MINISTIIYSVLLLIALMPLVGLPPFTLLFSKPTQPKCVQSTYKFKIVNVILSYFWAFIFAVCALITLLIEDQILQNMIPVSIQLIAGLPFTIIGMGLLQQYIVEKKKFASCREMFELMPYGVCKRYAKRIKANVVIQFELSGDEPIIGYLTIKNCKCSFNYGQSHTPTVTVKSESKLWLAISNGDACGIKEAIEKNYTTEGNSSIMLHIKKLFTTGFNIELPVKSSVSKRLYKEFDKLTPVIIKKVVVFYSGQRSKEFSKTLFLVDNIVRGIKDEVGEVEFVNLSSKTINHCIGCYNCWSLTPGKCIIKDDMTEMLQHYLDADLAIFASPLYIFSVNGVMKTFLDRLIPILKPYLLIENGKTMHPNRYNNISPTHILTVSASGFPEIENNFNGLREVYRQWVMHSQTSTLRGEILLPAAEVIAYPAFEDRKNKIANLCYSVGKQIVLNGCPSSENMRQISNTYLSKKEYQWLSNIFWENLDGKNAYLTTIEKIKNKKP